MGFYVNENAENYSKTCKITQHAKSLSCVYMFQVRTVLPAKSDSDVVFCLQLLSKTLTCTLHFSYCKLISLVY